MSVHSLDGKAGKKALPAQRVEITPEVFDSILSRVADGAMLDKLCEEPDMPSRSGVFAFMRRRPEDRARMEEAVDARADWRAGKIHALALEVEKGKLDPQSARIAIEAHRYLASKEAPRRYGDKSALEITGKDGKDFVPEAKALSEIEAGQRIAFLLGRALVLKQQPMAALTEAADAASTEAR